MAKCVLEVDGPEAIDADGTNQLCGEMEEVIEGDIHVMKLLWQQNPQEEYCWLLLIDTVISLN